MNRSNFIELSSNQNQNIKRVRKLKRKKYRDEFQEFILEGSQIIGAAISMSGNIKEVYISKEVYKQDNIQKLKEAIEKLEESIPEAKSIEVGLNVNEKPSAYDLVLVSDFENEDALERYRVHPEHQKVVEFIKKVNDDIAAVDYHI